MKLTSIIRTPLFAAAALAAVASAVSTGTASAEGYHVYSNAYTAHFPAWDRLNIRAWPAAHSRKVAHVKVGRNVFVERCILKAGTDWCKIRKGWKYGWVNGSFIQKGPSNFAYRHPWF